MPAVAVVGSLCSGHDGFPPRRAIEGDPSFLIDGIPIHCDGMAWEEHSAPDQDPHPGYGVASGSFFINGKAACMVGDKVSCGSTIVTGSGSFGF